MELNEEETREQKPPTLAALWQSWALKAGAVLLVPTLFMWSLYLLLSLRAERFPAGTLHLRNGIGMMAYILSAGVCAGFSGALLIRGRRRGGWNKFEREMFWGGTLLGFLLLMTGFEFLLFGEWRYPVSYPYLAAKFLLILGFISTILSLWTQERTFFRK